MMEIYNVGNNGVNLYLLKSPDHTLLIDTGLPGTLHDLGRAVRVANIKVNDIDHLFVTHFHPDHAGLVQELKEQSVKFVIFDSQAQYVDNSSLAKYKLQEGRRYLPLELKDNLIIGVSQSREFLAGKGVFGEVISTKGHSDDGIALVLDSGEAFIGDLLSEELALGVNDSKSIDDWKKLRQLGARAIFPGHGPSYNIE